MSFAMAHPYLFTTIIFGVLFVLWGAAFDIITAINRGRR